MHWDKDEHEQVPLFERAQSWNIAAVQRIWMYI